MIIKRFNIGNDEFIQVYLHEKEADNLGILKDINGIKKKNSNVAIFVNGTKDAVKTIREMLNYEKNSSNGLNLR